MFFISPSLIYLFVIVASLCAALLVIRYERAKRARWIAKRTEAIECALSLSASIDSLTARYEDDTPKEGTTEQLNTIGSLQDELCNILEQLRHYKPNRALVLLDGDMSSIVRYEHRLNNLSARINELQRSVEPTT